MENIMKNLKINASNSYSASGWIALDLDDETVAEVYGSDLESQKLATLLSLAPEMYELLQAIHAEARPEISRVNEAAGETIFNPVATETIDMAKDIFRKVGFVDFWNNYDKQIIGDSEQGDGFTTIIDPDVYEGGK